MLSKNRAPPPSSVASPPSPVETVLNDDDLLTQILVWLPAISILKFKSVSRRWLALITSPNFVHRRHSKEISGLCFGLAQPGPKNGFINLAKPPFSSGAPFRTLDFAEDPSATRILNSCNGLLLCSTKGASTDKKTFCVYNPTTKQSTTLPDLIPKPPKIVGATLAFDPSKSPHYKVICVMNLGPVNPSDNQYRYIYFRTDDRYHYKLVIYSSETRAWKPYGDSFTERELDFATGVFCGRSVHWPSLCGETSLRFDVEQEQLRDLPMPPTELKLVPVQHEDDDDDDDDHENVAMSLTSRERFFGVSGDHLHFVEIHESKPLQLEVFELEPDYSGWFIKYKADLSPVVEGFPEMVRDYDGKPSYMFKLLGLVREEEDEDDDESYLVLMLPCSHMAVRYKLKDGTFSKICDLNPNESTVSFSIHMGASLFTNFVYPFIMSLASV